MEKNTQYVWTAIRRNSGTKLILLKTTSMYRIFLFVSLLFTSTVGLAQQGENIHALVIGISEYYEPSIKDLQFAHKDAVEFANYLQSEGGGAVPPENIDLLTNEDATIANIYTAKRSLEKRVKPGDLVYFYFSGHGDVESNLYDLGFLLAADTPNKNYLSNAIRVEDINNMANSLSVLKNAKVVMITDACHAGKLSGSDNRGRQLVGQQLSIAQNNEIRIASCDSFQLSHEGKEWGNGRGAFSYYFIKGLVGLADEKDLNEAANEDGLVTLLELKSYLDKVVPTSVAVAKLKKQNPVVRGNDSIEISYINSEELRLLKKSQDPSSRNLDSINQREERIPLPQNRYFRNLRDNHVLYDMIDFASWQDFDQGLIIDSLLFLFPCKYDSLLVETAWYQQIKTDSVTRDHFSQQFGAFLHNEAQKVINGYLTGEKAEIEKRQSYNFEDQYFKNYAEMMQLAESLIDSSNYLHQIVTTKKLYFYGLHDRFTASIVGSNADSLMQSALNFQELAYALNPKAAYIINELGIVNKWYKNFDKAVEYYSSAAELIPSWAVPKSNLSNLYYNQGNYKLGLKYGKESVETQDDYYLGYVNYGLNAQNENNRLLAEECFLKAISINDQHFIAFYALGLLYNSLTKYALSEYYFIEAKKRQNPKIRFSIQKRPELDLSDNAVDILQFFPEVDTTRISDSDIMAMFCYARYSLHNGDFLIAERFLKRIVVLDSTNPLVYRYLAELHYKKNQWTQAIDYFELAKINSLSSSAFETEYQKLFQKQEYRDDEIADFYYTSQFELEELEYFIAEAAENIGYYTMAEKIYQNLTNSDSVDILPYIKLLNLYEKQNHYQLAEKTIRRIQFFNEPQFNNEIYAFYRRMIEAEENVDYYHYKAGQMMYDIINLRGAENFAEYKGFNKHPLPKVKFALPNLVTPGTSVTHALSGEFNFPILLAIDHLKATESFLTGNHRAEVCNKLGTLYNYYGDKKNSIHYYQLAMELDPRNESYKKELLVKLQESFEYTRALVVLDSMYKKNSLLYEDLFTYGQYLIQESRVDEGLMIFEEVEARKIVKDSSIFSEKTIALLLANKSEQAINNYLVIDAEYPGNPDTKYSLARLYASEAQGSLALHYLEEAFNLGFNYRYVLKHDYLFTHFRETTPWKSLLNEYGLNVEEDEK